MDEKIKISLPKTTLNLLKKDCEDFKILKENGSPNMNAFINTLILNFYEAFSASEESLHDEIQKAIFAIPNLYKEKAFNDLVKIFSKRNDINENKSDTATLSFKPTKFSEKAIIYIEHILLKSESLSSFYRRMFISYSKKTKNEREKIIYKENYELLQKAISKNLKVCITLKNKDTIFNNCAIHSISASKDELFNYVLFYYKKQNHTIRLASIKIVALQHETSYIPEKNKILFDRQVECAVQYPMYNSDNEPIKVKLTEKGKDLFKRIYLYRPEPVEIDENIYTFNCSANQLLYYFERFGDNAVILYPKRLGIYMRNYYYYAYRKYKKIYNNDLQNSN